MQKNGAGLHTASSCYWDNSTDGEIIVTMIMIILSSLGLVFVIILGFGAAIFNKV